MIKELQIAYPSAFVLHVSLFRISHYFNCNQLLQLEQSEQAVLHILGIN